jgi:hypothetical protein
VDWDLHSKTVYLVRRQVVVPQSPSVVALCERHDLLLHVDVQ